MYLELKNGKVLQISEKAPTYQVEWTYDTVKGTGWTSTRDIKTLEETIRIAEEVSHLTKKFYMPIDRGDGVYPRYDVIDPPAIGDKVSRCFNGDSYPCGEIVKITPSWRITTSTGVKFSRVKQTGSWKVINGYQSMISGHHDERNPHF